jgi:hypothetical protein
MKSGEWGKDKVMSTKRGDFVPTGMGNHMGGGAKEMGEHGSWGKFLPSGEKGLGVKGVSGGGPTGKGSGSLGGKWLPDGERGWAKGV